MALVMWIGTAIALVGIVGLAYSAIGALAARRANLPDEALRARLQRMVVINFASLGVAVLGLAVVIVAIILR